MLRTVLNSYEISSFCNSHKHERQNSAIRRWIMQIPSQPVVMLGNTLACYGIACPFRLHFAPYISSIQYAAAAILSTVLLAYVCHRVCRSLVGICARMLMLSLCAMSVFLLFQHSTLAHFNRFVCVLYYDKYAHRLPFSSIHKSVNENRTRLP